MILARVVRKYLTNHVWGFEWSATSACDVCVCSEKFPNWYHVMMKCEKRRRRSAKGENRTHHFQMGGTEKLSNRRQLGVTAVHLVSFYIKLYNINIKP